jgi:hypothetical protein
MTAIHRVTGGIKHETSPTDNAAVANQQQFPRP